MHYGIHFLVPIGIAFLFFKNRPFKVSLMLLAGILIDLDHLMVNPIFDPNRCSIGFHMLHSYILIPFYLGLAIWKKTRILGLALVIHILADTVDCLFLGLQP